MTAKLKLVRDKDEPIDIYAKWRADIGAIDWRKVHERKSEPVDLPDTRKGWVK